MENKKLTAQQKKDLEELMKLPEDSRNLLLMFAAGLVTGGNLAAQTA